MAKKFNNRVGTKLTNNQQVKLATRAMREATRQKRSDNRTRRYEARQQTLQKQSAARAIAESTRDTAVGVAGQRATRDVIVESQNKQNSVNQEQLARIMDIMYNRESEGNKKGTGKSTTEADGTRDGTGLND